MIATRRGGVGIAVAVALPLALLASPSVAFADDDPAQLPYETPRQTLIPGTPGMPGGFHLMVNGFAQAQNAGLGAHRIANAGVKSFNGGATYPIVSDDWLMGYGRDAGGWIEGLVMLNLEPFTIGSAGIPEEIGRAHGLNSSHRP